MTLRLSLTIAAVICVFVLNAYGCARSASAHDPGHPEEVNKWLGNLKDANGRRCCNGPALGGEHHAKGWEMHGGKPPAKNQTPIPVPPGTSTLVPVEPDYGYSAEVDGDCKPTTIKVMQMPDGSTDTVVWNFVTKTWDKYDENKVVVEPPAPPGEHRAWACINDGRFDDPLTGWVKGHIFCIIPNKDGM
jgi:hypothetical protein